MQVKKESVYNNIYNSALDEFYKNGYDKATMRNIAKNAGITLGNIYRYFPNKSSLFEEILKETYYNFLKFLNDHRENILEYMPEERKNYMSDVLNNYLSLDRKKVSILLNGSSGTKFEDFEEKNVEFIATFSAELAKVIEEKEGIVIVDSEVHYFIAETVFSSLKIMTKLFNDERKIKAYIEKYVAGQVAELIRRLGYKK